MTNQAIAVGQVVALYRFPVKSMAGHALHEIRADWTGFAGDRRFAWVQSDNRTDFPWLTARQVPSLVRYVARFADPDDPLRSAIFVQFPDGRELPLDSDEFRAALAAQHRGPIALIQLGQGTHDSGLGISLMSRSSLRAFGAAAGVELDERRFRQNIMIEAYEDAPFIEDRWIGKALTFGDRSNSARVRLLCPIPRCMMINLDPASAAQDGRVLRSVVNLHDAHAGVCGSIDVVGTLRVGDTLWLSA